MRQALADATSTLAEAGVASPAVDARLLAAHSLGVHPGRLFFHMDDAVPPHFADLVARRAAREPLQHILGVAAFGPLELSVGPGVFIPRPETELLAEWAIRHVPADGHSVVVDLCTGSGALACAIADACPHAATVYALEKSPTALRYARQNSERFGSRVTIVEGDVTTRTESGEPAVPQLRDLRGCVDVVVSNPPYVPTTTEVSPEVYADPPEAVFGGEDGMDIIPSVVESAAYLLRPGGVFGFEHDDDTSEASVGVVQASGAWGDIDVMRDYNDIPRFVTATRVGRMLK